MPYALILIGAMLAVAGIRNTYADLWNLVRNDFTSQGGFLSWLAVIAVVGGMGYIPKLKPLSIAFMTLLLLVLVLSHSGVFQQLQQFIQSGAGGRNAPPIVDRPSQGSNTGGSTAAGLTAAEQIAANLGAFAA